MAGANTQEEVQRAEKPFLFCHQSYPFCPLFVCILFFSFIQHSTLMFSHAFIQLLNHFLYSSTASKSFIPISCFLLFVSFIYPTLQTFSMFVFLSITSITPILFPFLIYISFLFSIHQPYLTQRSLKIPFRKITNFF